MKRFDSPTRRRGLTLTEALVAMFVAALGMISLLTLFPLGALQMGQALKDHRCTETALQADQFLRNYWRQMAEHPYPLPGVIPQKLTVDPVPADFFIPRFALSDRELISAFTHPTERHELTGNYPVSSTSMATPNEFIAISPSPIAMSGGTSLSIGSTTPPHSYPVFIDPIGVSTRTLADKRFVAGRGWLPRRGLSEFGPPASTVSAVLKGLAQRFELQDDLSYEQNGEPVGQNITAAGTPSTVERGGRYTWSAVLQQPDIRDRYRADMTILVFDGRSSSYSPPDSELKLDFTTGTQTATSIELNLSTLTPDQVNRLPAGKGKWIGVCSTPANRLISFHRIVNVDTDAIPTGKLILELQPPIPDKAPKNLLADLTPGNGFVLLFSGLADVFVRPPLTAK